MKNRISPRRNITGFAFPDHVKLENFSPHRGGNDSFKSDSMRGFFLLFFLCLFAILLILKLFYVQVLEGNYYRNLSDSNRIRTTVIHAPRGIIFDRNGTPLTFNTPGYRRIENGKTVLLSQDQAVNLLASGAKDLEIDSLRQYPYKDVFAHVIGYIGQITKEQLQNTLYANYNIDDLLGKEGIEQEYESKLKGVDGKELIEVDASGNPVRKLGTEDPIPGANITTTLDLNLQKTAFLAMSDVKKGVVIVSDTNGEILAMVSKPSFDPNLFTHGIGYKVASDSAYKNVSDIVSDGENMPLLNRAISGAYPPGSTFKIVTAAAGLESGAIDENFMVNDTGILQIGQFSFGNWYYLQYGRTEGEINVVGALKRSNDIFFYKAAEQIGIDKLSSYAKKFGLGEKLGIDLSGEASGLVPTEEWKQKTIGEPWYLGDTYHYGIGQGYLLATPLQVNTFTQAIANKGNLYKPHLLKISNFKSQISNLLSEKNFSLIRQGMIESCDTGGVAWPLFEFRVQNSKLRIDGKNVLEVPEATTSASMTDYRKVVLACKTGTAQHGGQETLPHAWITVFAPAYNPQIIITVLVESSGEGSNVAAPIAKKILEEWFSR